MDAVTEAVLEQKIDDLTLRFERAEERNRDEHSKTRGEMRELRGEMREVRAEIDDLGRTLVLGFASITASVVGAVGAAIIANAV